jgi:hypothetical protein
MSAPAKRLAILAFGLWEIYWAWVFFSAPMPDEQMNTVFALLMAVFLPLTVTCIVGLILLGDFLGRRKP